MGKRINFAEYAERRREEGNIEVELPDGYAFVIPPAVFWPPGIGRALAEDDTDAAAVLLVGAEAWERYTAAGGTWGTLAEHFREAQGADVGESQASSSS